MVDFDGFDEIPSLDKQEEEFVGLLVKKIKESGGKGEEFFWPPDTSEKIIHACIATLLNEGCAVIEHSSSVLLLNKPTPF